MGGKIEAGSSVHFSAGYSLSDALRDAHRQWEALLSEKTSVLSATGAGSTGSKVAENRLRQIDAEMNLVNQEIEMFEELALKEPRKVLN